MREVIQSLLEAEREARGIAQAARDEAARWVAEAERQAQTLLAEARQAARDEAARTISAALDAGREEHQRRLDSAVADIRAEVHLDELTQDRFAEAVVRCVCDPP